MNREEEWPDCSWESHQRRKILRGLTLTAAERLRWLEETMDTMRAWQGLARNGRPVQPRTDRKPLGEDA